MAFKALILIWLLSLVGCASSGPSDVLEGPALMCGTTDAMYELLETSVQVGPAPADSSIAFDWRAIADSVHYPEFARRARIEGTVTSSVVITPEGEPIGVWITKSPNELLSEAAKEALMKARYAPAPEYQMSVSIETRFRLR